ncbi:hypothetical protein TCSYLVIO_001834 [Trypanosoma cruzi]|nr:hypothetical protein TCSYLVIO_001834 [Trypanosoma cruzi]
MHATRIRCASSPILFLLSPSLSCVLLLFFFNMHLHLWELDGEGEVFDNYYAALHSRTSMQRGYSSFSFTFSLLPALWASILLLSLQILSTAASETTATPYDFPMTHMEEMVRSSSAVELSPTAWEMLFFVPTAQQLEELLMEEKKHWWCVVFVNVSSEKMKEFSSDFIQESIFPAVTKLQAKQEERQTAGEHLPVARVAVADIQDSRSYFDLYPFAYVFESSGVGEDAGTTGRPDLLTSVEKMIKKGRMMRGTRSDPKTPVILLFRPGAAAYLRKGRQWKLQQLKESHPLRMMVHLDRMEPFISEVPQGIVTAPLSLSMHLLSDYEQCPTNPSRASVGAGATKQGGAQKDKSVVDDDADDATLGILTVNELKQHQERVLGTLRRVRERQQGRGRENPLSLESLRGVSAKDRVKELMRRVKSLNNQDDDLQEDEAPAADKHAPRDEEDEETEDEEQFNDL